MKPLLNSGIIAHQRLRIPLEVLPCLWINFLFLSPLENHNKWKSEFCEKFKMWSLRVCQGLPKAQLTSIHAIQQAQVQLRWLVEFYLTLNEFCSSFTCLPSVWVGAIATLCPREANGPIGWFSRRTGGAGTTRFSSPIQHHSLLYLLIFCMTLPV